MPVSGEGIGVGMTSALAAAEAIKQSLEIGKTAGELYLENIAAMISMFNDIYPLLRSMSDEAKRGGQQLPILLRDGYQSTLRKF
jgi:flavin-dependent dehydrogenase